MNVYWLYEIPSWALFMLVIGMLLAISLSGALIMRRRFERSLGLSEQTNDLVGHFLSFTGAFYGIMLGLVAVGAWSTFDAAQKAVDEEAADLASLYRDVVQLPWPTDGKGQAILRDYAKKVITREWPDQQKGIVPTQGRQSLTALGIQIGATPIQTQADGILVAEAYKQFNQLLQSRQARLQTTNSALPPSLWWVIIIGAIINIVMTWFLTIPSAKLDLIINTLMAVTLGSVLAFVIAMDNPYRGQLSISSDSIRDVLVHDMDGQIE